MNMLQQLANIPRKPGHLVLDPRSSEKYITIHYSGVAYNLQTKAQEYATLLAEARYHINRSWGTRSNGTPIYGDGLMYDFVVLKDGEIVQTRQHRQKLWHTANATGNASSWSLHVMTGPGQSLTTSQKKSLFSLVDKLRKEGNIPPQNVVGHCEWPVKDGAPVPSTSYKVQPGQSLCPGRHIMDDIIEYRSRAEQELFRLTSVRLQDLPVLVQNNNPDVAVPIYTAPSALSPQAIIAGNLVTLPYGVPVYVGHISDNWGHIMSGIGFVDMSAVIVVQNDGNLKPPCDPNPPRYSEHSTLVPYLQPCIDPEKIVRYLANLPNQKYTEHDIRLIVGYYVEAGHRTRVDWVLALAQNLHETDHLRSWWADRPRRNPAGLRVTGEQKPSSFIPSANDLHWAFDPYRNVWRRGMSFSSWEKSTEAHFAWLLGYARTNEQLTHQQYLYITQSPAPFIIDRSTNRGVAQVLLGLNGRWAVPGTTYATRISVIANQLRELK